MATMELLLLAGLWLLKGGAGAMEPPLETPNSSLPPLLCSVLGPGGVPKPFPALLYLRESSESIPQDPNPLPTTTTTKDLEPQLIFNISDPWGALSKLWLCPRRPLLKCELSPTLPSSAAPQLAHPAPPSPLTLGGSWWLLAIESSAYAVSSLLQASATSKGLTASLSLFTLTPTLRSSPGSPLDLHCAFLAPPAPFSLEWRHQHQGHGQQLLTYHSATNRAPVATAGLQLLLATAGASREVTLRLAPLQLQHQGTFLCSIFLPQGHLQQLLEVQVLEPPKVSLHPNPLVVTPGFGAELRCDTNHYFPLEVEVKWQRLSRSSNSLLLPLEDTLLHTWSSGHIQGANGTYSRSSGAKLRPLQAHNHGEVYVCLVSHQALPKPLRVEVQLEVAGVAGPSTEDLVALFLLAYLLCGLCCCLSSTAPPLGQEDLKKAE